MKRCHMHWRRHGSDLLQQELIFKLMPLPEQGMVSHDPMPMLKNPGLRLLARLAIVICRQDGANHS